MPQKIEITEVPSFGQQEHIFEHVHFLEERVSHLEGEVFELRSIFMDMLEEDPDEDDMDDEEEDEDEETEDDDDLYGDLLKKNR
jgi:hypothetical protein